VVIPAGADPIAVLLHNHMGGSVLTSMYSDASRCTHREAAGVRSLGAELPAFTGHKYPRKSKTSTPPITGCSNRGFNQQDRQCRTFDRRIPRRQLALRLRDRGAQLPGAILAISPLCDTTLSGSPRRMRSGQAVSVGCGVLPVLLARRNGRGMTDPQVNLLAADLSGMPPTPVFYGEYELLAL